jgi:4-hydroxymandelate oxidase
MSTRRSLLQWMLASPALAGSAAWQQVLAAEAEITNASAALDVFDMERAAERIVPAAHWGYLQSGVDGDVTLRANVSAYARWHLLPRRLTDVSKIDLTTSLFGRAVASPIMLCPIGGLRSLHAEADIGVARAANKKNVMHIVSTQMSDPIEDIAAARAAPLWFQLYTTNRVEAMRQLLLRAQRAGCSTVAITVDLPAGRNTETATRMLRLDQRQCSNCHLTDAAGNQRPNLAAKAMFAGINTEGIGLTSASLTWDLIKQVKDITTMKVLVKGIEAEEDASLAVSNGADGIIVSNHGGRATETGRGTVAALPGVVRGAGGKIPVMVDGGVRRGTDVFKALALGASAVGIGRPFAWGLAAFGQAGVERVIDILNAELRLAMVGCGTRSIKDISRQSLIEA